MFGEFERGDAAAGFRAELERRFAGRVREKKGEFVAAIPGKDVSASERRLENFRRLEDNLVAECFVVGFVHRAEVIEVDHDDAQWYVVGLRFPEFRLQGAVEKAPVVEAGKFVGDDAEPGFFAPLYHVADECAGVMESPGRYEQHAVQDFFGDGAMILHQILQARFVKAQERAVFLEAACRRAGQIFDQAHFANEAARTDLGEGKLAGAGNVHRYGGAAAQKHEHGIARVALAEKDLVFPKRAFLHERQDDRDFVGGKVGENADLLYQFARVLYHA